MTNTKKARKKVTRNGPIKAFRISLSNFFIVTNGVKFIKFGAMNSATKITLSAKELDLVCNIDWILTKQAIIQKVYALFGTEAAKMQDIVAQHLPSLAPFVDRHNPKIAKGENYEQLPYVMLDYPRCFEKERTLAIRTMFWWGNFFSVHLQLEGEFKDTALNALEENFILLQEKGYSICIANDPWQHHFGEDNYLPLRNCTKEKFLLLIAANSFVKIGNTLPLRQWEMAATFIETSFMELAGLLKDQFPKR
jgi:hypothetical protein